MLFFLFSGFIQVVTNDRKSPLLNSNSILLSIEFLKKHQIKAWCGMEERDSGHLFWANLINTTIMENSMKILQKTNIEWQ